jgi:hypothetical protein
MSNSQVPRIQLNNDGTITLEVSLSSFDEGTPVEISGHVIQENGAVAPFYSVQVMPEHSGEGVVLTLDSIRAVPGNEFTPGFPIMVVARAAEVWVTTLENDTNRGALRSRVVGERSGPLKAAWKASSHNYAAFSTPSFGWYPGDTTE